MLRGVTAESYSSVQHRITQYWQKIKRAIPLLIAEMPDVFDAPLTLTLETAINPGVFSGVSTEGLPLPLETIDGISLLSALCSITSGIMQLCNDEPHYLNTERAKGLISIISGIQLLVFVDSFGLYHHSIALLSDTISMAAPAFIIASACEVLIAAIDCYHAYRESLFADWVVLQMEQVDCITNTLERNTTSHKELTSRRNQLLFDIRANFLLQMEKLNPEEKIASMNQIQSFSLRHQLDLTTPLATEERLRARKINKRLTKAYTESKINLAARGIGLVGVSLLAISTFIVCPPLQLAGAIICISAAIYTLSRLIARTVENTQTHKAPAIKFPNFFATQVKKPKDDFYHRAHYRVKYRFNPSGP